ncbi:MAG: cytochrome c oxidase assembly protein [Antricoccus sp.]
MEATWTFLETWDFDPALVTGLILSGSAYLWAVHEVNRRQPDMRWPRRYTVSFMSALALAWFVLLGPIGAFDDTFFWAHMVQHLALMMLIGPLLLLGAPVLLILRVSSKRVRRTWIIPIVRSRLMTWLTRPLVGWLIFAGVLLGTHFSPWYDFALEHPLVHHYVEHPLYLGAALIFYYPLLPVNPGPRRVPYWLRAASLFTMMFPETMTGFFIYAAGYQMFPFYTHVHRPFGPGPMADQQTGGAIMWAGSMLIDTIWVSLAVLDWLRSESKVAARIDVQTLKKLPATPRPAQ